MLWFWTVVLNVDLVTYVVTSVFVSLDLMEGYRATEVMPEDSQLMTQCKAIADMKFTYVVSCQQYGIQKRSNEPCAHDILRLMTEWVSLRTSELVLLYRSKLQIFSIFRSIYSNLKRTQAGCFCLQPISKLIGLEQSRFGTVSS